MSLKKIEYKDLNDKQKENYNFQKVSAILADYGYITIRLHDDWKGADFVALHINGSSLMVQLKSRLTFDKKYLKKNLQICFRDNNNWYIYDHDKLLNEYSSSFESTDSWRKKGLYHKPQLSKSDIKYFEEFLLR